MYHSCAKKSFRYLKENQITKSTLQNFMNAVTISYINLFIIMTPEAERFNGWAAMLGFVAAVGAYVTTGQIIPGWF